MLSRRPRRLSARRCCSKTPGRPFPDIRRESRRPPKPDEHAWCVASTGSRHEARSPFASRSSDCRYWLRGRYRPNRECKGRLRRRSGDEAYGDSRRRCAGKAIWLRQQKFLAKCRCQRAPQERSCGTYRTNECVRWRDGSRFRARRASQTDSLQGKSSVSVRGASPREDRGAAPSLRQAVRASRADEQASSRVRRPHSFG